MTVRTNPPENEIPVVLPLPAVLGRDEDVVVALIGGRVYTTGVVLDLVVHARGVRYLDMLHPRFGGYPGEPGQPLLGVEFADGRLTVARGFPQRPRGRPGPALHLGSGSSFGPNSSSLRYYLTPLPPPGPLAVHFAWPALDLPENEVELDGGLIAAAAAEVVVLWPPEPPVPPPPMDPPLPLDLPEGSWFNRALPELSEPPS